MRVFDGYAFIRSNSDGYDEVTIEVLGEADASEPVTFPGELYPSVASIAGGRHNRGKGQQ